VNVPPVIAQVVPTAVQVESEAEATFARQDARSPVDPVPLPWRPEPNATPASWYVGEGTAPADAARTSAAAAMLAMKSIPRMCVS
jgi:hypothetical protein